MSRPDSKDVFALKPGIFSWFRDQAYNFVYYEIGAGLDFIGDLFRGPTGYSESLHRQSAKAEARKPQAKPLTKSEQAIFVSMLKRTTGEPQMAYWKRKKALLNTPDRQSVVRQHIAMDKAQAQTRPAPQIRTEHTSRAQGSQRDGHQKPPQTSRKR